MAEDSMQSDLPEEEQPRDEEPQDAVSEGEPTQDRAPQDDGLENDASQSEVTAEAGSEAASEAGPAPVAATEPSRAGASERTGAGEASFGEDSRPNRRKVREGLVVSIKMDKTAVVGVVERVRHPRYAKTVQRTKRLYAHDTENDLRVGDRVRVAETRPLSKLKRWRVVEVLERAK
jgi:small subunit ribosomal protein S17